MEFQEKEVLINSFVYPSFSYRPLIWNFCSAKSVRKIEQIQTRALRIFYNDIDSDYKTFLDKSGKYITEVKYLSTLGLEVFKTLNDLYTAFMEEVFHRTKWLTHRAKSILVNVPKTAKHGDKNLRALSPHIWNSLLEHIKQKLISLNSENI